MEKLPYNKVTSIEDFSDPELRDIIRDIYRHEIAEYTPDFDDWIPDSKQWESAMSVRALRHFGALNPTSLILGVGAGTKVLNFYLPNHVHNVFATDLYLNAGNWSDVAPFLMLIEPENYAPYNYDINRLSVQHMDGRLLKYPDNTFDGIYSSGSIEHFGSLDGIASASFEMGRVLKPGGVLTLSTEYKIKGPPDGDGWDPNNTLILSRENILRFIVEASGLEFVDELDTEISHATMLSQRNLAAFLDSIKNSSGWEAKIKNYPNLILVHEGYVFCSVHLTLKKTEKYTETENSWAAPTEYIRKSIQAMQTMSINRVLSQLTTLQTDEFTVSRGKFQELQHYYNVWNEMRMRGFRTSNSHRIIKRSGPFKYLFRLLYLLVNFGKILEAEALLWERLFEILKWRRGK